MSVQIPIHAICKHCDIYKDNPWNYSIDIKLTHVQECIENNVFEYRSFDTMSDDNKESYHHAARIAYLVINPDFKPIEIDVGIPGICDIDWFIMDGSHRLAAAIYRKDKFINADVSGSVDLAKRLFKIQI